MPVIKCSNGKYRIGNGACVYDTEAKAEEVWTAIKINMADSYNDYPDWGGTEGIEWAIKKIRANHNQK